MLKGILVFLLFAAIALVDLPRLIKKKEKKQMIVYACILGAAFALSELHTFRMGVPSPDRLITDTVHLFFRL